jgi:hypothetical protein
MSIAEAGGAMTKRTNWERQELQRRLDTVGCPVELAIPRKSGPGGLIISQGPLDTIKQFGAGLPAIELFLELTWDASGPMYLEDVELELPWQVSWSQDPRLHGSRSDFYALAQGLVRHHRNEVLNHLFAEFQEEGLRGKRLSKGQSVRGFLLGWVNQYISAEMSRVTPVEGRLVITDASGLQHESVITLRVEKMMGREARRERRPLLPAEAFGEPTEERFEMPESHFERALHWGHE